MTLTQALHELLGPFEAGPRDEATLWPLAFAASTVNEAEEMANKPFGSLTVHHQGDGFYAIRRGKRGRYLAIKENAE